MPEKLKSELIVLYGFVKSISPPCSCGCVEKSVDDLIKLATVLLQFVSSHLHVYV